MGSLLSVINRCIFSLLCLLIEEESSEDEGRRKKKGRRGKGGKNNTNAPVNLNEVNDDDEFLIEPSKRSKKNYITIGFIGSPNVGKSSLVRHAIECEFD